MPINQQMPQLQYRGSEALPDPFCDIAALIMPQTMSDAFRWCERVYERMGVYRSAVQRIIAYFITELDIACDDRDERQKYEEYLNDDLSIKSLLMDVGLDLKFCGNSITSIVVPLKRYIECGSGCGLERPLSEVMAKKNYKFAWRDYHFTATCPRCGKHSKLEAAGSTIWRDATADREAVEPARDRSHLRRIHW